MTGGGPALSDSPGGRCLPLPAGPIRGRRSAGKGQGASTRGVIAVKRRPRNRLQHMIASLQLNCLMAWFLVSSFVSRASLVWRSGGGSAGHVGNVEEVMWCGGYVEERKGCRAGKVG